MYARHCPLEPATCAPSHSETNPTRPADRRHAPADRPAVLDLSCRRRMNPPRPSARTAEVASAFGLAPPGPWHTVLERLRLELAPGRIIFLTGPSGSGKSSLLAEIERCLPGACSIARLSFPPAAAIVDAVAPGAPLSDALSVLTACGLGEARLWLRRYEELSAGEQFRALLARAVGLRTRSRGNAPLLCDEFASTLHRRAARALSFGLRKLVTRLGLPIVAASSQDDVLADLAPDLLVRLDGRGSATVESLPPGPPRPFSLMQELEITAGRKRDYEAFAAMHYRRTDELGFVDKVFVLRARAGEPLAIVVYAHPPAELALRNRATQGRFVRNLRALNRCVRILRRLVVHPDVRGCGLGHHLVHQTLPRVGVEYVECLASMGEFNPVFEKAGMQRVGRCDLPTHAQRATAALHALGVDPLAHDFAVRVARQPVVRAVVSRAVLNWYTATTGEGAARVQRQGPDFLAQTFRSLIASRPVYYLWHRPDADV